MSKRILSTFFCFAVMSLVAGETTGVLVMAHGGTPRWNSAVTDAVKAAGLSVPTEIFFGMAVMPEETVQLNEALKRLHAKGAGKIIAIPFLVSSHSEVYRQYAYVLGLSTAPGFSAMEMAEMSAFHGGHHYDAVSPLVPARSSVPVTLLGALDSAPELFQVLKDRIEAFRAPPGETRVLLVAHGPNDDMENQLWLADLNQLARRLKEEKGYQQVISLTLRDDAPKNVREAATKTLRDSVQGPPGFIGRTVLVPVLLSVGGIEEGLKSRLSGLSFEMAPPLLPHPALSRWLRRQAETNK